VDVLEQLLEEPLFDALRTKEQLGYSVSSGARWTSGVLGFGVRVLSAAHGPAAVGRRVAAFLKAFEVDLEAMAAGEFRAQCEALALRKLERARSLAEEAGAFWEPLADRQAAWRRRGSEGEGGKGEESVAEGLRSARLEAAALARITKRDVQACLARWVTCPASAAHLAVHVVGRAHEAAGAGAAAGEEAACPPPGRAEAAAGEEAACPPPGRARITLTRGGSVEVWALLSKTPRSHPRQKGSTAAAVDCRQSGQTPE